MATQSTALSAEFDVFAAEQVASGRYADAREVLDAAKAALEREKLHHEKLAYLKQAVADGDASGTADGDVFARVRERAGLPTRTHA